MNLYSTYSDLLTELLKVMNTGGLSRRAPFTISKLCTAFIENLQYIIDGISDNTLKESLNSILNALKIDFENLDDAMNNKETELIIQLINSIFGKLQSGLNSQIAEIAQRMQVNTDIQQCITPPAANGQQKGGEKIIQIGGSAESEVYFDMNDVFREICGLAEANINSQYSRLYPHYNVSNLIKESIDKLNEDVPSGNISPETANITKTAIANLMIY